MYYEYDNSGRVLIYTHVLLYEAHISIPDTFTPLGAQALQRAGYDPVHNSPSSKPILVKILSSNADTPNVSTPDSIGIDLYSANSKPIKIPHNGGIAKIPTDIAIEIPKMMKMMILQILQPCIQIFRHHVILLYPAIP